jgi:hypothetical protein
MASRLASSTELSVGRSGGLGVRGLVKQRLPADRVGAQQQVCIPCKRHFFQCHDSQMSVGQGGAAPCPPQQRPPTRASACRLWLVCCHCAPNFLFSYLTAVAPQHAPAWHRWQCSIAHPCLFLLPFCSHFSARSLTAGQSHRSTRTLGTFNRAPPELLRLGRLSPSCDVYAYGVMIWELYTGQVAFSGEFRKATDNTQPANGLGLHFCYSSWILDPTHPASRVVARYSRAAAALCGRHVPFLLLLLLRVASSVTSTPCNLTGIVSAASLCCCSGLHYGEVFERVALQQERPPIPPEMPEVMRSLMVSCWADSPIVRPTFRMIQQSLADMIARLPDSADRFVADL